MKVWNFKPLDSCFFRGAKSFNQGEGGFLDSQFPPTAQTLAGVIRASIGDAKGVNWQKFRENQQAEIASLIGKESDDAGKLSFAGPYIYKSGERLYPVPLHLLYSDKEQAWTRLKPSKSSYVTDMGKHRLPVPASNIEAAKPIEHGWLNASDMNNVLQGDLPKSFIKESSLFSGETRVGIGRDNKTKQVEDGMLYFTQHIRLGEDVSLAMSVEGVDDVIPASMVRLGGEGRMAHLMIEEHQNEPLNAKIEEDAKKFVLSLLTHADFSGKSEPDIEGMTIVSACIGKAVREGGWDYKKKQPKPLKSLIPAGSSYFVEFETNDDVVNFLKQKRIGDRTAFGYGEVAVGIWNEGEK
ncbi:MAG: type III-B CRISPR module-associated protein Cmr3 [Mariprofundaceae bacterium]|nr:type III-B CRISPR module-associated protein Cmr3 [Mariprofundaceae bacterium]